MNKLPSLILGLLAAFGLSWAFMVIYPYFHLARLQMYVDSNTGESAPPALSGLAAEGRKVYAANGCVSCHTQQVRLAPLFADVSRSLGPRPLVARDYLREQPAFFGNLRLGPDLANVGLRSTDRDWYYCHLFEPASMVPGSIMPAYRFLFEVKKIQGQPSRRAVHGLIGPQAPASGYEVLPTHDAEALVAYLLSLRHSYALPEAVPLPKP